MRLFDTHSHLIDARFDSDREAVIASLEKKNVKRVVDVGCTLSEAEKVKNLIEGNSFIYGACGIHPHNVGGLTMRDIDALRGFYAHKKMIAVGEIGLDYHYDFAPRETQKKWFAVQLELAAELDLPVILHIREAYGDALSILEAQKGKLRGIMHCFSGSLETAFNCLDLGLYIAFGGAITFKNAKRAAEIAYSMPEDRLLIETDCPYMTPEPFRGKRNDPSLVTLVNKRMAEIRGVEAETMAEITYQNGLRAFK
ncbi:MAG: TatD family hydrolase [Clostridia bacterium]